MNLLKNKISIITGAGRGIGKSIAEEFAKNGSNLAITFVSSSSEQKIKELSERLSGEFGVIVKYYKSDASILSEAEKLADDVFNDFGKIDVLVNNAGITKDTLIMRMSEEQWTDVIKINLNSVFYMTKAVQKYMIKQKNGSIINMSSVVGLKGNPGQSNYAASKAGIIGFTKSIAQELGSRGIRCNAIAPGFIETEMTGVLDQKIVEEWKKSIPMRRGGTPKDVAELTIFLASEMSSYITGEVIRVDGGLAV